MSAKLTVPKLREELQRRGLDTSGLKAVLVARLDEALAKDAATAESTAESRKRPREEESVKSPPGKPPPPSQASPVSMPNATDAAATAAAASPAPPATSPPQAAPTDAEDAISSAQSEAVAALPEAARSGSTPAQLAVTSDDGASKRKRDDTSIDITECVEDQQKLQQKRGRTEGGQTDLGSPAASATAAASDCAAKATGRTTSWTLEDWVNMEDRHSEIVGIAPYISEFE
mmetsp:Transcript_11951/g.32947  ORF Transcript_11951/g.32947 Transcript_11951/m.32947 type:complete len:231 (-) Transcript_11951:267-959(-)|eukprot:scaffold162806_cov30-Tisochrysis_lutea.AAC.1